MCWWREEDLRYADKVRAGPGSTFSIRCEDPTPFLDTTTYILALAKKDDGGFIGYVRCDGQIAADATEIDVTVEKVRCMLLRHIDILPCKTNL